ncbi:phospholipid carrier-dependent glycosyltransferase [Leucobacter sp. Z1108]|uniref:phospholipid carrier-dependent glycosyltransferase n=1 Tax=Leucobacter sp. Z1108 TaxID=3439066 RepID=UPI003F41854C
MPVPPPAAASRSPRSRISAGAQDSGAPLGWQKPRAPRSLLAPLAVIAVLALAAALRFWALGRPDSLVFDELYYVRDAVSQLANGFPTTWPDDDPAFGGERALAFSDQASTIAHPPLGKWLIGLGVLLFGADTGWGWRSAVALAGVATVGITMRLGWLMTRSLWVACVAGLLLAIDGVHVVLTRVALLDGLLTLFVLLGALFVWRDVCSSTTSSRGSEKHTIQEEKPQIDPILRGSPSEERAAQARPAQAGAAQAGVAQAGAAQAGVAQAGVTQAGQPGRHIIWRRPWLLAAGLTFGAAAAIKWSGLYPLAAFLLFIVAVDTWRRFRTDQANSGQTHSGPSLSIRPPGGARVRPLAGAALQALVTAALALPAAALAYLVSWWGWIASPTAQNREPGEPWWVSLAQWHADALAWHATLSAPHPYQSHPLTWPLGLRPTAMYEVNWPQGDGCPWPSGCVAAISPLPNLLVTWGGVAALLLLTWVVVRSGWIAVRRPRFARNPGLGAASAFVLVGYLSGWLPWVLTFSRSAVFQFYAVVLTPFAALALALVLGALWHRHRPGHPGLLALAGIHLDSSPEALLGRRIAVTIFLAIALVVSVLFFPAWSGMPIAEWFWRAHLWLPGWD